MKNRQACRTGNCFWGVLITGVLLTSSAQAGGLYRRF